MLLAHALRTQLAANVKSHWIMADKKIVKEIRAALEKDRINLHRYPIQMAVQNGDLILEGVVEDIAAKKLALLAAAETHGVQRIVDRLKVTPAEKMGDAEIRDHVCKVLLEESALERCFIHGFVGGGVKTVRKAIPNLPGRLS